MRTNAIALLVLAALAPSLTFAQRATEQDLVTSALSSALRAPLSQVESQLPREANKINASFIDARDKQVRAAATLVLASGYSAEELAKFVEESSLDLLRLEIKNAIGTEGRIATASIGVTNLLTLEGSLEERIQKSIGAYQFRLGKIASADSSEGAKLLGETAFSPDLKVYAVDVIGTLEVINSFTNDSRVAAAILQDEAAIVSYEARRRTLISQKTNGERVLNWRMDQGIPPGIDPSKIIWRGK